jgi:hypothetical protein
MSVQYGGDKITFSDGSTVGNGWSGFKNRLINSAMQIDQRNAGASVTVTTDNTYVTVDRFKARTTASSAYSVQQNAGSVTPPTGFANYLGVTSLASTSVGTTGYYAIEQWIEGFNTYDLAWGTANASSVTLSFWVRSSLTGTFGGNVRNSASDYCYPFSYVINSANTWEYKTVTIAGPTAGTWTGATNSHSVLVCFGLGVGSTYSGTANSWQSGGFYGAPTGATSVVGTSGATFYITGVQLEKGSTATSFDYRPYSAELAMCQRYYEKFTGSGTADVFLSAIDTDNSGGFRRLCSPFKVQKRATPTVTLGGTFGGSVQVQWQSIDAFGAFINGIASSGYCGFDNYTASAEL